MEALQGTDEIFSSTGTVFRDRGAIDVARPEEGNGTGSSMDWRWR